MPLQTNISANIPLKDLAERILRHTLNITEKHDIHYNGHYAHNNSYNACAPKIYPYFYTRGKERFICHLSALLVTWKKESDAPSYTMCVCVCVFILCSDERDLDGLSVSKCDAVCFCLSHSNSQRPLSLTTEGSLYVFMASSTNRMHAEHVRANMHMQTLMYCMCALLYSNPHAHTHTHTANRKSDALPLTDHSTLYQNSSKHLWASIAMFSQHVLWISYRKALCLSHTTEKRICIGECLFMLVESTFDSEIILPC